jgi:FemAB-related protein (PEP-CTERM system-associated)
LLIEHFAGPGTEWDEFVRRNPGATHCHVHGWRQVIARVFGHECTYLAARDDRGTLAGVLPLVRVRSVLFGHYLISMPFLNYGGPLGTAEAVAALAAHAMAQRDRDGADLLELRSATPLPLSLPVSHRKLTVVLDLPQGDPCRLWLQLPAKVRNQVRRPQRDGITVRFGLDQLDPFFAVFSRHMRDLGTPTQSRRFFEAVANMFPEDVWFGCAYLQGRPVAGGCGFRWDRQFEMTWAASLRAYRRSAPNMALYWAFMERAVGERLDLFNFGRCTPGSSTHHFKRQWGARDVPLWWYQAGARAATPSPHAGLWALGPAVWRRLPLAVATALGPRVVRYLP